MLDDFLFIGPTHSLKCLNDLNHFILMCKDNGIPIKMEKTQFPTTVITISAIEVDFNAMICRLPDQKLVNIKLKMQKIKQNKKVSLKVLQSFIDLFSGRPWEGFFLRRMIDLICGVSNLSHYIRLTCEARAD